MGSAQGFFGCGEVESSILTTGTSVAGFRPASRSWSAAAAAAGLGAVAVSAGAFAALEPLV
jgi:hypothetical protein